MSRGHCGNLLKVSVTCTNTNKHKRCCWWLWPFVESHETEVPFPHMLKFHISEFRPQRISQEQRRGCVVGLFPYVVIYHVW